jgi:hypothetical protein
MLQLHHNRFQEGRCGKVCLAMVVLLCLSIVVQMLGAPMTLLSPGAAADAPAVSASEGFSIPSSLSQLTPSVDMVLATDEQPSTHVLVLASTLFHPPVL